MTGQSGTIRHRFGNERPVEIRSRPVAFFTRSLHQMVKMSQRDVKPKRRDHAAVRAQDGACKNDAYHAVAAPGHVRLAIGEGSRMAAGFPGIGMGEFTAECFGALDRNDGRHFVLRQHRPEFDGFAAETHFPGNLNARKALRLRPGCGCGMHR